MYTTPFWIEGEWPGRLAVSPRPRGGDWLEDEMKHWRRERVNAVASLLMPDEVQEFDLELERKHCEALGISFYALQIIDRNAPSSTKTARELIGQLTAELSARKNVLVHCRQGIGRAGLIVVAVLMSKGRNLPDAIELVSKARGREVPETPEQLAWLRTFAADFQ